MYLSILFYILYANIHLLVDTKIYDSYEVQIKDGMITVILHEIKNVAPILNDCSVK